MATLGSVLNWIDVKNMFGADGALLKYANVLEEMAPIVSHGPWVASNKPLGHVTAQVTALPSVGRYRLNRGVTSSKGAQTNVEDAITMVAGQSTVDKKLLQIYGGELAARRREARLFAEAMKQQFVSDIVYGSIGTDPEGINGLMTRMGTLGDQVIDCGGTASNALSSILFITWGEDKTYFLHPKNAPAGLQHDDLGEQLVQTTDSAEQVTMGGRKMRAFVDDWQWDYGICTADPRYQCRAANIDSAEVLTFANEQALADYDQNIVPAMLRLIERNYNPDAGMSAFYMPRKLREGLAIQYMARTGINVFKFEDVDGKRIMSYQGFPIYTLDGMINTEAQIS